MKKKKEVAGRSRAKYQRIELGSSPESPAMFYVNELAEIMGINSFFIHKFFREKGFPCRNIPGTSIKFIYASVFCHFYRELKEAVYDVRDDRNTKADPNRIPTIQNMLYRDPTRPPLSKQEREDIDRDIFASSKLEFYCHVVWLAGIYRVNYYKDGTMSIDKFSRYNKVWERKTKIFSKDLFIDYVLEFDLILHEALEVR